MCNYKKLFKDVVTFTTAKFQWESVQSRILHEGKNVPQADFAGVQVGHANSLHWPTESC